MKAGKVQRWRYAEIDRALAPDDLHDLLDREREAEGEQQFGDMAVLVDAAQAETLDPGADRAGQQRRDQQRRPEAEPAADLKSEEGAEHVEARMREIQHAEHAEDDGEAAGHQKQQHAEQHTVERGDDDQFKHGIPPRNKGRVRPENSGADGSHANGQFGRSILQVVGSMVCAVSTLATDFQPQPVFSSSNGSLFFSSPSTAIYIG